MFHYEFFAHFIFILFKEADNLIIDFLKPYKKFCTWNL